ncbi:MAG: TetR/AcrR family transcriptional regulator [Beutenbergiaceae bacterium]
MDSEAGPMEIKVLSVARRQLGEVGPAALSLRAIAREVGVVPSALYRYFPGRDAILTALIRSSYQRLADAVALAEGEVDRQDLLGRWIVTWAGTRRWALEHRHEYALLYGTPVVGYQAPQDTVIPATRVLALLAAIVVEAHPAPIPGHTETDGELRADALAVLEQMPALGMPRSPAIDASHVLAVIEAWTTLFGAISFELFGHYRNSVEHPAQYLEHLAQLSARRIAISSPNRTI